MVRVVTTRLDPVGEEDDEDELLLSPSFEADPQPDKNNIEDSVKMDTPTPNFLKCIKTPFVFLYWVYKAQFKNVHQQMKAHLLFKNYV